MKKSIYVLVVGMFLLTGCMSHDFDEVTPAEKETTQEEINQNVKKVFGVNFSADQDWCTTTNSKVTISIKNSELSDVEKVQILTVSPFGGSDANGAKSLNESKISYGQSVTLYYDAPKMYTRLYAACVSKSGEYFIKGFNVGEQTVEFTSNTVNGARTRSGAGDFDLKKLVEDNLPKNPVLSKVEDSFSKTKGWSGWGNNKLYSLSEEDEKNVYMQISDYTTDYKTDLYDAIFNIYLQNKVDNVAKVKNSPYYIDNNYPLATGEDPIILAPICKNDSIYHEIENCDLYYYYFDPNDLKQESDPIQFLKNLPKYKAVELWTSIRKPFTMKNNEIKRQTAWALIYWGKGVPTLGTAGSYIFPKNLKIGFMIKSVDPNGKGNKNDKNGELYSDARLNKEVNNWGHFATPKFGDDDPRMAWFWANKRTYLCCETGADRDINDIVFEVLGGLMVPPPPVIDQNKYTFCFEDRQIGDFDLNDVVVRAYRKDATTVVWQLVACGAHDEVFVKKIPGNKVDWSKEVHELFNVPTTSFVNTESKDVNEDMFIIDEVTVPSNFSFLDEKNQPAIYNKTKNRTVSISLVGEDPHAIMVPYEFRYPLEKICISRAYSMFNSWGEGSYISDPGNGFKWYLTFDENLVIEEVPVLNVTYNPGN